MLDRRGQDAAHVFHSRPASRWLIYLLLVPAFIVMTILGIFFFTAFLALFMVAAATLGLRLWWVRRGLRDSASASGRGEGDLVIEDGEIGEEKSTRTSGERQHGERHDNER